MFMLLCRMPFPSMPLTHSARECGVGELWLGEGCPTLLPLMGRCANVADALITQTTNIALWRPNVQCS